VSSLAYSPEYWVSSLTWEFRVQRFFAQHRHGRQRDFNTPEWHAAVITLVTVITIVALTWWGLRR